MLAGGQVEKKPAFEAVLELEIVAVTVEDPGLIGGGESVGVDGDDVRVALSGKGEVTDLAGDVVRRIGETAVVDLAGELNAIVLRDAGGAVISGRGRLRRGGGVGAAVAGGVVGVASGRSGRQRCGELHAGDNGMDVDRDGVRRDTVSVGGDEGHGVCRRVGRRAADGEVRDAAAGVAIPGAAADRAGRRVNVGDIQVRAGVGVFADADAVALAVGCGRGERLPDLAVVERFADDGQGGSECDGEGLTDDRTGVTVGVAVNGWRRVVTAADDRQTEGNRKEKQNSQTDAPPD